MQLYVFCINCGSSPFDKKTKEPALIMKKSLITFEGIFAVVIFILIQVTTSLAANWQPLPNTEQPKCYNATGAEILCPTEQHSLHADGSAIYRDMVSWQEALAWCQNRPWQNTLIGDWLNHKKCSVLLTGQPHYPAIAPVSQSVVSGNSLSAVSAVNSPGDVLSAAGVSTAGLLTGNSHKIVAVINFLLASKSQPPIDTTEIYIGDNGVIEAFKGKTLSFDIKIFVNSALDDGLNYTYTLLSGPSDLSISADGLVQYEIPWDSEIQNIPISLQILNKETSKSYSENAEIVIMATEIIASGLIGSEGGQIADEWKDVVLIVPVDTVTEQTLFEVLRGIDKEGYYAYTIRSSTDLLKALQLRLPDPVLRKVPQDSESLLSQQSISTSSSQENMSVSTSETETNWIPWRWWSARYVENKGNWIASTNRLKNDLPINQEPSHRYIKNFVHGDAAKLLSLCKATTYDVDCADMTPVLFIHGYTLGGDLGGGEGTWGKLPELIAAERYAVFEFQWRTNARFVDAAANLADAIKMIQAYSHKKVHIVAHSFGGLLSRAYLQNYAVGRPYQDNVQSLLTLGTPHSGIFDTDGTYHELPFKKGQDSSTFEFCLQISCQQAGEPTPWTWTIVQLLGPDINISPSFGIDENQGKFIEQIDDTSGDHGMPVDAMVLMGLPANSSLYFSGDGLISYAGQRFSRTWENSIVKQNAIAFGEGEVRERILGVSALDHDAVPGARPSLLLRNLWFNNNWFHGYFHSTGIPDYKVFWPNGAAEPNVPAPNGVAETNFHRTGAPHAALTEIIDWLNPKPAEPSAPLIITLHLLVVDAATQQPVSGAKVYFNINGTPSSNAAVPYGETDAAGELNHELPFYPFSKYTALIVATGYKQDEFAPGYMTNFSPGLSDTEFGIIQLRTNQVPTVTTVASLTGRIWMDRNLGASRVALSSTDEEAYGGHYQWGRVSDGHEKWGIATTELSTSDIPGHGNFIKSNNQFGNDWRNPKNDALWQGINGVNNPCPAGFRLPTLAELVTERESWISDDADGAFASPLKLVVAGKRDLFDGIPAFVDDVGYYSSSTLAIYDNDNLFVDSMYFGRGIAGTHLIGRADGQSVRCIKN